MALMTWDPFREMDALRREIDRAFENLGGGRFEMPLSRFSFLPGRAARAYPLLNISEDENHVYVEALAPGINPEALKVTVVRNQMTITGEKPELEKEVKPEAYHRAERGGGRFTRTITLPSEVNDQDIKAEYKNGLLLITLPKAEAAKPKQIAVNVK